MQIRVCFVDFTKIKYVSNVVMIMMISLVVIYSTVRDSVLNHCDRRITLLSDIDVCFGLFNLFTYFDMPFGW